MQPTSSTMCHKPCERILMYITCSVTRCQQTGGNLRVLSLFYTWRLYSSDAKRKQEFGNVIGWRKNSPQTSRNRSYSFFCSREQFRQVENGLKAVQGRRKTKKVRGALRALKAQVLLGGLGTRPPEFFSIFSMLKHVFLYF